MADPAPINESNARGSRSRGDSAARPAAEEAEANQTLADGDQTLADSDQTAADTDQTAGDGDQSAADQDQAAADDDQAASDRDFAAGGDRQVHDSSQEVRELSAQQRRDGNQTREESALTRDSVAHARDLAAAARDQAAAALDRQLDERDAVWAPRAPLGADSKSGDTAAENRGRAAADRVLAAQARGRAAADRAQAASDRAAAADDRLQAQEDRDALLARVAVSERDALTGARTRGPGLADLDQEIDRARRTASGLLTIAYMDVVGLKQVNDLQGHSAGDAVLRAAVDAIRAHLRSYDVIVRVGGDEFVCVMTGVGPPVVRERFDSVRTTLAADPAGCAIRVGIACLTPEDSAAELIDRADSEMQLSAA